MRRNVEYAIGRGLSLGLFSANTSYWQISLDPIRININVHYTTFTYQESTALDLFTRDNYPDNDYLIRTCWRNEPLNCLEDALIGVMYKTFQANADIIIDRNAPKRAIGASSVPKANTNSRLGKNDKLRTNNYLEPNNLQVYPKADCSHKPQEIKLKGLLRYEVDRMLGNAPSNDVPVASYIYTHEDNIIYADMPVYKASSGAIVLTTASAQLTRGLDDYNAILLEGSLVSPNAR